VVPARDKVRALGSRGWFAQFMRIRFCTVGTYTLQPLSAHATLGLGDDFASAEHFRQRLIFLRLGE
jgi:hypothetical protein